MDAIIGIRLQCLGMGIVCDGGDRSGSVGVARRELKGVRRNAAVGEDRDGAWVPDG